MSKGIGLSLIGILSLALMSGCGGGGGVGNLSFTSNDAAVAALGNTTWGVQGEASISFNEKGQLASFSATSLPPEIANLRLDGQPFNFTVPPGTGTPFDGQSFEGSLVNSGTSLNGTNLVMDFTGKLAGFPMTFQITTTLQTVDGTRSLSGLTGSGQLTIVVVTVPLPSQTLTGSLPEIK
jgi:hypothetical protein